MSERGTFEDIRTIRLGGGAHEDEVSPRTLVVLLWTSAVVVTLALEIVWGASVLASLVSTGGAPGAIASALALALLPIPGVFVYVSVWWSSLRVPGSRSGRLLAPLVPLSVLAGALLGLGLALT